MSWDVMLINKEGLSSSVTELPSDFRPEPLGDASEVRKRISMSLYNKVDWSNPSWGIYEADDILLEFNADKEGTTDDLMLHISGHGDPFPSIARLCRGNGWIAIDMTTGEFVNHVNPSRNGWDRFTKSRKKITTSIFNSKHRRISLIILANVVLAIALTGRRYIENRTIADFTLIAGFALAFYLFQSSRDSI